MHAKEYKLAVSRQYLILLIIVYFLSVSIVCLLSVLLIFKAFILLLLSVYMGSITWRYCLLKADASIQVIRFMHDNKWVVSTRKGAMEAILLGDSTVTRWVSVLRFRVPESRWVQSCIVFRDSLAEGNYRQLVVAARLH